MGYQSFFATLSGVLVGISTLLYTRDIWRGFIKPAKATFVVWTTVASLTSASMWAAGTLNVQMTVIVMADLLILGFVFRFGSRAWTNTDLACITLAFLGIILWWQTDNPLTGMFAALIANIVGTWPLLLKSWRRPEDETKLPWWLMLTSSACSTASIPAWTWMDATQPVSYLILGVILVFLLHLPPQFEGKRPIVRRSRIIH